MNQNQNNNELAEIQPEEEKLDLLEQLQEDIGYGPEQYIILIVSFALKFAEGFHMALFSHILIPFKYYYQISEYSVIAVSSISFIGLGIGSLLPGYFLKIFTRRFTIILFCTLLFVFSLFQAIFDNLVVFTIVRFFNGLFIGVAKPIMYSLLFEFLPIRFRTLSICLEQFCFLFGGTIILNGIMMLVNPKLKIDGLKKVLYTLPIPPLLLMILALVFIKDSPKNLFLKGNPKEAIQLLEKMSNKKFDDDYKNKLKELKKMDEKSTLWDLMQRKYRRVISILSVMFIINAYMTYAILLISSITFKVQFKDIKSEEIESKQAIVFWMMIPGTIVAGLICEISWLGRKNTCIIGYGGFALFGIFACIFPQYLEVFLGLMGFFSQFNYNVSYVYVCEAFPTKIRTIALGFCVFWNKLSGFITHFFLVFLHNQYNLAPYIFGLIASTMLVLLTWFLPYDTLNRPIETEHHDHDHSENSKDLTNKVDEQTSLIKKEA